MGRYSAVMASGIALLGTPLAFPFGQEDSASAPPGFFGTYEPAIELKWDSTHSSELFRDAVWSLLFRDELGIEVEFTESDPDIITLEGENKLIDLRRMAAANKVADMTDVWAEFASPLNEEVTGGLPILDSLQYQGKLKAIPGSMVGFDSYSYLWVRQDWLDNLGLNAPRTIDDLRDIAHAFANDDPDRDGRNNTFAMILDKSLWYRSEGFFWSFGAYPDTWLLNKGENRLAYGAIQPQIRDALAALREMYEDGQIDPDWIKKSYSEATLDLSTNAVGIVYGGHWSPFEFLPGWESDRRANWVVYPPPTTDASVIAKGELESDVRRIYAVRSGSKYPESLVKMMNLHWQRLYGPDGDYEYWHSELDPARVGREAPITASYPWMNVRAYKDIQAVYDGDLRPEKLTGVSLHYYNNIENASDEMQRWAWTTMFADANTSPFANLSRFQQTDRLFVDEFYGPPTSTMIDSWSTLQQQKLVAFTRIIQGEVDLDVGFKEFVEYWSRNGGDAITEEINDWYRRKGD